MTRGCFLLVMCLTLPPSVRGQYVVSSSHALCSELGSVFGPLVARLGRGDLVIPVDPAGHPMMPYVPFFEMHVSVPSKGRCYVFAPHLVPFDPEAPERALAAIVERAKGDYRYPDFREWIAIHGFFVNGLHGARIQGSPDMELLKLEVLERTARTISTESPPQPDEQDWLDSYRSVVYPFEPGGFHTVRIEEYWSIHEQYATHASADSMAWVASQQPVLHDCGGGLRCFLEAHVLYRLEYLKRHPAGQYVPGALNRLAYDLGRAAEFGCPEQTDPSMHTLFQQYRTTLAHVPHALAREAERTVEALAKRCLP